MVEKIFFLKICETKKKEVKEITLLSFIVVIPFVLQALTIGVDEVYFHYKRGLPKWERIGHPVDTFSVLLCLSWVIAKAYTPLNAKIFIALAILSCLCVTKDEFVHKHHCPAAENWLHALLFTLHPITLFVLGMIWYSTSHPNTHPILLAWFGNEDLFLILKGQLFLMTLFFFYQLIFWNIIWRKKAIIKY